MCIVCEWDVWKCCWEKILKYENKFGLKFVDNIKIVYEYLLLFYL